MKHKHMTLVISMLHNISPLPHLYTYMQKHNLKYPNVLR